MTAPRAGVDSANVPDGTPATQLRYELRACLDAGMPFEVAWPASVAHAARGDLAWVRVFTATAAYWRQKYEES